jgi:RNA polymerase sigma factor (sigma-70 family)
MIVVRAMVFTANSHFAVVIATVLAAPNRRSAVSDLHVLNRIQSFLTAPPRDGRPTYEESEAWIDFYQIYDPVIRMIVKRWIVSESDRDDLVQEIWALLIRRLPRLNLEPARGTLCAWVAAVARHHAGRHARRGSRRRHEPLTPELASVLVDPATSPVIELERKQRQALVHAVIADLGESMPGLKHRIIERYWINRVSPKSAAPASR